ncbi:MAG: Crp/Fnr family transcriptional regulator [Allomuricauda sp.]
MSKQFFNHINQYATVSLVEFEEIMRFFELRSVRKKEMVMKANTPCTHTHFVLQGCLNMFFPTEKGVERTIQFGIENWWLTDFLSFGNKSSSNYAIQAVEKTTFLSISRDQYDTLLEQFPQMEKYFRAIYQIGYGASLNKMRYLQDYSKEDIYFHFTEQFPDFAQRVPQYLIASFLGLTPEYVSEIRAKRRS